MLGIGGSASTDGGAGMLQALGARLSDADGRGFGPGGAALAALDRVDLSGLHPALAETRVIVASDVDNPLLGPDGAAAVYGPQKGASEADVATLDAALARWADVVEAAVAGRGGLPALEECDIAAAQAQECDVLQPRRPSARCGTGPGQAPQVASGSRPSPCWAPSCSRASTSSWTSSGSPGTCRAPASSSPAKARSTHRPSAARPPQASRRRRRRPGYRSSLSPAGSS